MSSRRRFLFLMGSAAPGLWLAGSGLLRLDRRFVLALSGSCSFCTKRAGELISLAGMVGRPTRICNECLGVCWQILAEDPQMRERALQSSRVEHPPAAPPDDELSRMLRDLEPAEAEAKLESILAEVRRQFDGGQTWRLADYQCSFCDGHRRDVAKLISGPRVFICDGCIAGATAILSNVGGVRA